MRISNLSIRPKPLKLTFFQLGFLTLFFTTIYLTFVSTDFFARQRLGDLIIPTEIQLTKTGPYRMEIISEKHKNGVLFVNGDQKYFENWNNFGWREKSELTKIILKNQPIELTDYIRAAVEFYGDKPIAYLWISGDINPTRKVWRIILDDTTHETRLDLMTYKRAKFIYDNETIDSPKFDLLISLIWLIGLFFSCFEISNYKNREGKI